ncbi:MAG TPA: D-alanyl-D-alanine carboxypeptidase family protein, partial [Ktedonobacteraceae bacterium]|nr:D-alanyl-D-alanine carboxypeptidase family protein [Ktedonobacteraceae bacterium]
MYTQSPPLFETPLAPEVSRGLCYCDACNSARALEAPSPGGFVPIPVERPGGGRIRDKRDPTPADIVTVQGISRNIPLHRQAAAAWRALVTAARAAGLQSPLFLPVSGYRSWTEQNVLWQRALRKYGSASEARKFVAPPGGSAHQSGRAIDFYLGGNIASATSSANIANLRAQ